MVPASFASEAFFGNDAFIFINKDGVKQAGRYRILPVTGRRDLSPIATSPSTSPGRTCCTSATPGGMAFTRSSTTHQAGASTAQSMPPKATSRGCPTARSSSPGTALSGKKERLRAYRDMLAAIREKVAALKEAGKSMEQAVAARPTTRFRRPVGPLGDHARCLRRTGISRRVKRTGCESGWVRLAVSRYCIAGFDND